MKRIDYVELRARSAFSFLEGAALPEDLVARAAELDYAALALGDRDGLYGAPRFYQAAARAGLKPIVGAELTLADHSRLYVLVPDRERYKNLCRMITASKLRTLPELRRFEVVVVTDRTDLEKQLGETATLTGETVRPAKEDRRPGEAPTARLQRILREAGPDLVFAMIQKYQERDADPEVFELPKLAPATGCV